MQGYVTSEPFAIEKAGKFKPKIFLLADHGFNTYSTLIETRREMVEKQPGLVQRFVDASAIGWYNYLYGDNKAANELIRKHNPEMSQELIDYSIAKMKEFGIVDSGDTLKDGIGAMTDARMASFFDKMVKAGVVKPASISASPTRCSSSTRAWGWSCGRSSHPSPASPPRPAPPSRQPPRSGCGAGERQHRRDDGERGRLQVERERIEPANAVSADGRDDADKHDQREPDVRSPRRVIAASAPERWRLARSCSTNGAPARSTASRA